MVAVPMDAGWREDRGEAIQKLEGRETQGGTTSGIGLGQDVENLVRAVADQVEPFESKRWSGTIPNQPFQPLPVSGLDADDATVSVLVSPPVAESSGRAWANGTSAGEEPAMGQAVGGQPGS